MSEERSGEMGATLDALARIIDSEAFGRHAMTWTPGPADFPSNWQNRRNAAYRKADEVLALIGERVTPPARTDR